MRDLYLRETTENFFREGLKDEEYVAARIEAKCGGTCKKSAKNDDIYHHIDIWWDSPKKGIIGIDVKGKNKNHRKDEDYSPIHWVEMVNVNGRKGWAFSDAEYIAFRCVDDSIIFVKPKRLQEIYDEKVANKTIFNRCPSYPYVPYQRKGNKDLAFKINDEDLKELASFII